MSIITLLTIIGNVYAVNYILWYSAVDDGEIRWWWTTKYSTQWNNAVSMWNNYWDINIAPDTIYTYEDLTISDVYLSDVTRGWGYLPSFWADNLYFNKYFLDWDSPLWSFTSNEKQKTIWHELWHALWLDHHNISWNVLRSWKYSYITLWTQDKADYDYLWGN